MNDMRKAEPSRYAARLMQGQGQRQGKRKRKRHQSVSVGEEAWARGQKRHAQSEGHARAIYLPRPLPMLRSST